MNDNLITIPDAARLRNKTPATIWRWVKLGWITAEKVGRDWLIDRQSLLDFDPPRPGVKGKGK